MHRFNAIGSARGWRSRPIACKTWVFQTRTQQKHSIGPTRHSCVEVLGRLCDISSWERRAHCQDRFVCLWAFWPFVVYCLTKLSCIGPRAEGEQNCLWIRSLCGDYRDASSLICHTFRRRDRDIAVGGEKKVELASGIVRRNLDSPPETLKRVRCLLFVASRIAGGHGRERLRAVGHRLLAGCRAVVTQVVMFGHIMMARLCLLVARLGARALVLGPGCPRRDRLALAASFVAQEVRWALLRRVVLRAIPWIVALITATCAFCSVCVYNATWRTPATEGVHALHQALIARQLRAAIVFATGCVTGEQSDGCSHRHQCLVCSHFVDSTPIDSRQQQATGGMLNARGESTIVRLLYSCTGGSRSRGLPMHGDLALANTLLIRLLASRSADISKFMQSAHLVSAGTVHT